MEIKESLKHIKIESVEDKIDIGKPEYNIYDEEINKKMLKKYLDENK